MVEDFLASGVVERLAARHRVIVLDRPGFGHSTRPKGRLWGPSAQAELILAAMERLGVRRWKDHLPEAGALFPGGVSKRQLPPGEDGGVGRFVVETRRAELGHWASLACLPLFPLWNPPIGVAVVVAYGLAANLPCIVVQRYNRGRGQRLLAARRARTSRLGAG